MQNWIELIYNGRIFWVDAGEVSVILSTRNGSSDVVGSEIWVRGNSESFYTDDLPSTVRAKICEILKPANPGPR